MLSRYNWDVLMNMQIVDFIDREMWKFAVIRSDKIKNGNLMFSHIKLAE